MTETLLFPGLGLEFELNRVAFQLGPITVYWYGIIAATALSLGMLYCFSRARSFGVDPDKMVDLMLVTIVLGVICARIYYVAFSWDQYKDDLMSVFHIWEGGIAIYGGILGGILGIVLMCRLRDIKLLPMLDLAVAPLILGQAIGRWGNFVNIEAFGCNTDLPWGMTGPSIVSYLTRHQQELAEIGVAIDPQKPVHPTFFYESAWCLLGFFILLYLTKHRRFDGQLTLFYAGWYGAGRFVIEGLRTDSLMWGGIRVSQMLALVWSIASFAMLFYVWNKIKKSGDPEYLKVFALTLEGQKIVLGESQEKTAPAASQEKEETSKEPAEASLEPKEQEKPEKSQESEESHPSQE